MDNKSRFLTLAMRQKFITRWGISETLVRESVLEHAGMTAMLAVLVTDAAKSLDKNIDAVKVINYGYLHDNVEILTLDLPSPLKNSTPEMAAAYQVIEEQADERLIDSLPQFLKRGFTEALSPIPAYEKKLGKACDVYHAYLKACFEVSIGNDIEFDYILEKQWTYVERLFEKYEELKIVHDKYFDKLIANYDKSYQDKKYNEQFTLKPVFSEMEHAAMVCTLTFIVGNYNSSTDVGNLLKAALINNDFGSSFYPSVELNAEEKDILKSFDDYVLYLKSSRDALRLPKALRKGALESLAKFKSGLIANSPGLSVINSFFTDQVESFDQQIELIGANANLLKSA